MQPLAPLTLADLTASGITPLQRLEVWYGGVWQEPQTIIGEAQSVLMSMSSSMAGGKPLITVVAGSWSARLYNPDNLFHPLNTESGAFPDVFVVGTQVSLSQGLRIRSASVVTAHRAVAADVATIGTAAPHGLSGGDLVFVNGMADPSYNGLFTVLAAPDGTHFTYALEHDDEAEILDPWGSTQLTTDYYWRVMWGPVMKADFNLADKTIDLSGLDYCQVLSDYKLRPFLDLKFGSYRAFQIAAGANVVTNGDFGTNINGWTPINCTLGSIGGGVVGNCCELEAVSELTQEMRQTLNNLVVGGRYRLTGYAMQGTSGVDVFYFKIGTADGLGNVANTGGFLTHAWVQWTMDFVAPAATLYLSLEKNSPLGGSILFDEIVLWELTKHIYDMSTTTYPMDALATGAWLLMEQLTPLPNPTWAYYYENEDWTFFWDGLDPQLRFNQDWNMPAIGTWFHLLVFEEWAPEDVLFAILANSGLYASYAAAKAACVYTATGTLISRVSFELGVKGFTAVQRLAERVHYSFYFRYDGRPVFVPKPAFKVPGAEDLVLTKGQVTNVKYYRNDSEFFNHVRIEGEEQAHPVSLETSEKSPLIGFDEDPVSIAAYGEKNVTIKNTLWQVQAAIDASASFILAGAKDPKGYVEFDLVFCPIPVEWGDTVKAEVRLSGTVDTDVRGLIRDIKVKDFVQTILLELEP